MQPPKKQPRRRQRKRKNDKKKEEEEQAKIQEASKKRKRDAARLKAAKAIEKEAKKKDHATNVNVHLMDLDKFDKANEEEEDGASKILFDEKGNSPERKRIKRSIGALKSKQCYSNTTAGKKIATLQKNTQFIDFGVTLMTNDKSG